MGKLTSNPRLKQVIVEAIVASELRPRYPHARIVGCDGKYAARNWEQYWVVVQYGDQYLYFGIDIWLKPIDAWHTVFVEMSELFITEPEPPSAKRIAWMTFWSDHLRQTIELARITMY